MKKVLVIGALLFVPSLAFAAGFAKQSLFLSKSTVTEGDTVLIHAVVNNDTGEKFTGKLEYTDNAIPIGTVPVSLLAGEADTLSVSWKPTAGSHSVTANLEDPSGNVVETEYASFTISQKPQLAAEGTSSAVTTVDSAAPIEQAIANFSPATAKAVAPIFSAVDSGRAVAAKTLNQGISYTKQQVGVPGGQVLGAEAQKSPASKGIMGTAWVVGMTLLLYLLSILQYVVSSAGVFYPVFALLFFFILWRLYRRYRRPRYA